MTDKIDTVIPSKTGQIALPEKACAVLGLPSGVYVTAGKVNRLETPKGVVWVKTLEPPTKRYRRYALKLISIISPLKILRPSKATKGGDTLLLQAQQIQTFDGVGLKVPKIYYSDRDFLILADAGSNLEPQVIAAGGNADGPTLTKEQLQKLLLQMSGLITKIHKKGLVHGRPKIRDFAYLAEPDEITILDLEERPLDVMPLQSAQARDIFLWLIDLCAYPASREITDDALMAFHSTMQSGTRRELEKLKNLLRFIAPLVRFVSKTRLANREMVGGLAAFDCLDAYFNKLKSG